MSDISKAYEPQSVEDKWYQFWLDQKCFVADAQSKKPAYSIVIPPPNVTGVLTMGHVLNNTIQDILARKARMDGKEVLWLPGTDHAGIATQTVVERTLKKAGEIKHRDDLGREKFLERVWQWKEKHGGIIIQQLKKLGASCDWTRERFTMDPEYSRCVQKVFVELYRKGLIYRGKRMVNWCPASLTALSDEEVVMKEQRGSLYYFKVQVVEKVGQASRLPGAEGAKGNSEANAARSPGRRDACPTLDDIHLTDTWLTIATTRPETIPGDTAVAVNPKDPRYAHLIGKHIIRPLPAELPREQKLIPIIGDEHVDFEFGTGVLKVTPAHDKADFEIGVRHNLPQIDIMHPNGHMNELAGKDLNGLDRFKARKVATEKLAELGALEKEEPYTNNIGFSERADVPIEPRLSEQWWLRYPQLHESLALVQSGTIRFRPDRWVRVYQHWIDTNIDWCLSRQLWWGHRLPVWYHKTSGEVHCDLEPPRDAENWEQDPDVLDTWFSSWLWPFVTMGWPEKTDTLAKFYPTTDLVTGPDIIFLWVARMIMGGLEFTGEKPFRNVYFTGIIRDKQGRKMSKSLGNSPDPLDLIGKYGADALRFGTMRSAPLGQDILFDEQNVELGRNFCNKLWNACRFRQMQSSAGVPPAPGEENQPEGRRDACPTFEIQGEIDPKLLTSDDKWILLKLDAAIREMNTAFAEYKFSDATATLYRFFWSEYCDWYVEASKAVLGGTRVSRVDSGVAPESTSNQSEPAERASSATPDATTGTAVPPIDEARKANTLAVIDFVLSHTLRLFHPFLPFITEELWHGMGYSTDMPDNQGGKTIMFAPWPKPLDDDFKSHYGLTEEVQRDIAGRQKLVIDIRNLRSRYSIPANKKLKLVYHAPADVPADEKQVIQLLAGAEAIEHRLDYQPAKGEPVVYPGFGGKLFLPTEGLIDVEAEKARLKKEQEKIESEISKVEQKLANPNFTQKVPANVLEEHKQRLADWQDKLTHVKAALAALQN